MARREVKGAGEFSQVVVLKITEVLSKTLGVECVTNLGDQRTSPMFSAHPRRGVRHSQWRSTRIDSWRERASHARLSSRLSSQTTRAEQGRHLAEGAQFSLDRSLVAQVRGACARLPRDLVAKFSPSSMSKLERKFVFGSEVLLQSEESKNLPTSAPRSASLPASRCVEVGAHVRLWLGRAIGSIQVGSFC